MILLEENFNDVGPLFEVVDGKPKKTYLAGVFTEAEVRNRNGRIYDLNEMTQEVNRINDLAKAGKYVLGHLDHPEPQTLDVRLKDVAIKIVEMKMDGRRAIGKAEVLEDVPNGQILKGLINSGINVGVSTRGNGVVEESSGRVKKWSLKTVDAVSIPSSINAYPGTIQEQLDNYKRGEVFKDLAEAVIHDKIAQKYFEIELRRFVQLLRSK